MRTRPFRPFTIRTAGGRDFRIDHPEMAWATPGGRVVFVATSEDSAAAIDLLQVTWVEPVGIAAPHRMRLSPTARRESRNSPDQAAGPGTPRSRLIFCTLSIL